MIDDNRNSELFNYDMYEDEDEIDLVKLVSTNANDANQYLLFLGSDGQYYAKNVSKIEELVIFKDLQILKNNDHNLVIGTADVRGEMLPLVNFDRWIGGEVLTDKEYELVIIVSFGGYKFGLVVKEVEYITTIEPSNMQDSSSGNLKSTFISKVMVGKKEVLCTIVDSDKIILDVFGDKKEKISIDLDSLRETIESDKTVFFADDSSLVRNLIHKTCTKLGVKHQIYDNGKKLLYELHKTDKDEIGLIVTDIEMPVMNGKEVLTILRGNEKYNDINILVFTNMSNSVMEEELLKTGATKVVTKIDIQALAKTITQYMKK